MLICGSQEHIKILQICEYRLPMLPSALHFFRRSWKESKTFFFINSSNGMKLSELKGMQIPKTGITSEDSCYAVLRIEAKPQGGLVSPLGEVRKYCPTPSTMDNMVPRSIKAMEQWRTREGHKSIAPACLKEWVHPEMWPTPTAQTTGRSIEQYETYLDKHRKGTRKPVHLEIAVQLWPTPSASEHRNFPKPNLKGQLNPDWVEWLMGFPLNWSKANNALITKIKKAGIKLV